MSGTWRRPRRFAARVALAASALLAGAASFAAAQTESTVPAPGRTEFTLLGGFGYGVKINSGVTEEQSGVLVPQLGVGISARFEYLAEGELAKYFRPSGFAAGFVPVGGRYFFATGHTAPYVAGGLGMVWTDLDVPEISRRFNFIVQGSLGVRGGGGAWTVEARFLHYSNANTVTPNLGLNSVVGLVGVRIP